MSNRLLTDGFGGKIILQIIKNIISKTINSKKKIANCVKRYFHRKLGIFKKHCI